MVSHCRYSWIISLSDATAGLDLIDYLYKGKSVEVRIPSAHPPDSMLPHENCGVRIIK
jgi:hypothetical protein